MSLHSHLGCIHLTSHLNEEEVELHWVIPVHILIREEELLAESEHGGLLNALLPQTLVRVQPVHCQGWEEERVNRDG